jgi:hypothetical protein
MILAFLSVLGIILLFFRSRPESLPAKVRPDSPEKLFTQVIMTAHPQVLALWEEGDRLLLNDFLSCREGEFPLKDVGRSFYQCQPHLWQCYWEGGVTKAPALKIDLYGQTFHVRAQATFAPISPYSSFPRYYEIIKGPRANLNFHYGVMINLAVDEIPGLNWPMILTDTCRDTYLPERIYGYGPAGKNKRDEGFVWDNFGRNIFIDKFYVTNQQVNEWLYLTNQIAKMKLDRSEWAKPALLDFENQVKYCSFWGKRVLEAKLFDAATMTPGDLKNPTPDKVWRPDTPWQRDLSKSYLGMARANPDYQLSPLDCQLAQVKGCPLNHFATDSATWMGIYYGLGFYPEAFRNTVEPEKNLKMSSRFFEADSHWHQLGLRSHWIGKQEEKALPVAFRCYEEVE